MKLLSSDSSVSRTLCPSQGRFAPAFERLPTVQAHSARSPLQYSSSDHPQIAQCKQKLPLVRSFSYKFKSGAGKAHLFHGSTILDLSWDFVNFADIS
jgi:hypothetical protein